MMGWSTFASNICELGQHSPWYIYTGGQVVLLSIFVRRVSPNEIGYLALRRVEWLYGLYGNGLFVPTSAYVLYVVLKCGDILR